MKFCLKILGKRWKATTADDHLGEVSMMMHRLLTN